MGDERTYEQPIVLRAVESEDAMTARAVNIPFDVLEIISTRIVNEVPLASTACLRPDEQGRPRRLSGNKGKGLDILG